MPLTPIDVQQKTFVTTFRGYDLDEVDDFLDEVVTSLKDYEQRLHDAQQRIAILEAQAQGRGDSEAAISRALVSAQRSADLIVADAKSEADRILAGARLDARTLESERDRERQQLESEIGEMRAIVAELKDRIAALAGPMAEDADTMVAAVDTADEAMGAVGRHESPMTAEDDAVEEEDADEAGPSGGMFDERWEDEAEDTSQPDDEDDHEDEDDGEDDDEHEPISLGWEVARDPKVEDAVDEMPGLHERVPRPWEDV